MSLDTSTLAESACLAQLTPVFLDLLGNEQQEDLYRRVILEAHRQNEPEVLRQAQAWLLFSIERFFSRNESATTLRRSLVIAYASVRLENPNSRRIRQAESAANRRTPQRA
jgi:hypothetical protein